VAAASVAHHPPLRSIRHTPCAPPRANAAASAGMLTPSGPYPVGCRDFAWAAHEQGGPASFTGSNVSTVDRWCIRSAGCKKICSHSVLQEQLLDTLPASPTRFQSSQHVAGRLFYPAPPAAAESKWPAATWIKSFTYAKGYATFAFFSAKSFKWRVVKNLVQGVMWLQGESPLPLRRRLLHRHLLQQPTLHSSNQRPADQTRSRPKRSPAFPPPQARSRGCQCCTAPPCSRPPPPPPTP
jgi:hypothetical protein